jgi:hypothetical protein
LNTTFIPKEKVYLTTLHDNFFEFKEVVM